MGWLRSLKIVNFQSHEKTILNLHPGLNCIVGVSNRGKTAIFRAVDLLRRNRPGKFRYHSDFAKSGATTITATTSEGIKTRITKTRRRTKYTLIEGNDITHWRKLNKDVPDLISSALNISDTNIQWQFDNPFLISNSHGEIARVIHEKTKIDKADAWIKELNSKITTLKHKHLAGKEEVVDLTKQLRAYNDLPTINRILNRTEKLDAKIQTLEDTYISIDGLIANILDAQQKIAEQRQYLKAEKQIDEIENIDSELDRLEEEGNLINRIFEKETVLREAEEGRLSLQKQYIQILKREKKCPFCFSPITSQDVKRIIDEITHAF